MCLLSIKIILNLYTLYTSKSSRSSQITDDIALNSCVLNCLLFRLMFSLKIDFRKTAACLFVHPPVHLFVLGHFPLSQNPTTVVLIRVWYFVLLDYSYKSWLFIKTRDRFGICWSWRFQNTPYMSNLTKFWLRYLRLKTHDWNLLFLW